MTLPNVFAGDREIQRNFWEYEKRLDALTNRAELTGARNDPEAALASLIALLAAKGILADSTTAT